jgi:cellulose synthase/poly-beta-1,6-N-acetylglucosamine synthase-like glycosyltransferase
MMHVMVTLVVAALFVPLMLWWSLWLLFALLALLRPRSFPRAPVVQAGDSLLFDILIPAHNEEILLPRLLETLRLQTPPAPPYRIGTIVVVADHCTDRTAALARHASLPNLQVLERSSGPRGKPAALRDGLDWLKNAAQAFPGGPVPPQARAVMILDADCTASPNLVEQTAAAMQAGASVTQCGYILDETRRPLAAAAVKEGGESLDGEGSGQRLHSAAFIAFALKNLIRPRGMAALGLPTQLFGTGMTLRSDVLENIRFADHLTEDLAMSYDLLLAGVAPCFVPGALVRSPLPQERAAMSTQKLRWETGQLHTWTKLPVILIGLLIRRPRGWLRSAVAALDWSAPPVAMAVLLWAGVTFASGLLVALRWASPAILILPAASIASLTAYVVIGGMQISGAAAVGRLFLAVPRFFFWKLTLYARMLAGRGPRTWQRTPRSESGVAPGSTP